MIRLPGLLSVNAVNERPERPGRFVASRKGMSARFLRSGGGGDILPMNRKVGRVTPCAPPPRLQDPDGAHGVTRPNIGKRSGGSMREELLGRILSSLPAWPIVF